METRIQEAMSTGLKNMNGRKQDGRGREDLKCGSFSDGLILSSSKEDSIDVSYRAILIIFASFLMDACQLLRRGR
jgi:hypothetical protein